MIMNKKESVKVLEECIDLQLKKSKDYQNPNSNVTQAMHYRRGVDTIHDIIQGKVYRAQSLLESGSNPSFESIEDTYKDIINYCSFAVSWIRKSMQGQDKSKDIFNRSLQPIQTMDEIFREVEDELVQRAIAEDKQYNRIKNKQSYEDERPGDASQYC